MQHNNHRMLCVMNTSESILNINKTHINHHHPHPPPKNQQQQAKTTNKQIRSEKIKDNFL